MRDGAVGERVRRFLLLCAVTLSVLLALATLLAWGARRHWFLDLLSHFPVQIAATAIVPLAVLIGLRRWKAAILPAVVLALNAVQFLPACSPAKQPSYSGAVIRAISANVLRSNRHHAKVIDYIRTERPDFFLVMEIDETWLDDLEPLREDYPHCVAQLHRGAFGIALFSRLPIEDHEVVLSETAGVPMIRATLLIGGHRLNVLGVHPLPPVGSGNTRKRNGQLREIAALAASLRNPKLVLGDLNITPWSPFFSDLLQNGGLRDGRKGFGIQPTWPMRPGFPSLLQIPIDHTLVSDDVEVVARQIGHDVGSDHLPVEMEFRIGE